MDWVLGECEHGLPQPYCPQCITAKLVEERAAKQEERDDQQERDELRATVASQARQLDDAHALIRMMRTQQKRRRLLGRAQ
jgi:hypothetical protein